MGFTDILFSIRIVIGYFAGLCVFLLLENTGVPAIVGVIMGVFALVLVVKLITYIEKLSENPHQL
jgi:hypothetical protein